MASEEGSQKPTADAVSEDSSSAMKISAVKNDATLDPITQLLPLLYHF